MALSAQERRTLARIEAGLRREAPKLDAAMSSFSLRWPARLSRRWRATVAAGLAVLAIAAGVLTARLSLPSSRGKVAVTHTTGPHKIRPLTARITPAHVGSAVPAPWGLH